MKWYNHYRNFTGFLGAGILGASLGIVGGLKSCNYEYARHGKIPLGFSEITQIEKDTFEAGRVVAEGNGNVEKGMATTYYLAGTNDISMKIFECWNTAHESGKDVYLAFAEELATRFDSEKRKHHYELIDLFPMVADSIASVEKKLAHFHKISNVAPFIIEKFEKAWTEKHQDNYHTVFYPSIDSDGDIKMESRRVYDDTDHSYWYHKKEGDDASRSLDEVIASLPEIRLPENIFTASRTNLEGETAAKKSRKGNDNEQELNAKELREIADTWYQGATMMLFTNHVYDSWDKVAGNAEAWREAKKTAKDISYKTYSSSDAGPQEYQLAKKTGEDCKNLLSGVNSLLEVVDYTTKQLPSLEEKIHVFIQASKDRKEIKQIGEEVLSMTQDLYQRNFVKGFEVDRFREGMVTLWSFLGAVAGIALGAGIGFGVGKLIEQK